MPAFVKNWCRAAWMLISNPLRSSLGGEGCFYNVWNDDAYNVWSDDQFNSWGTCVDAYYNVWSDDAYNVWSDNQFNVWS